MKLASSRPNDNMADDRAASTAACGHGRPVAALLVFSLLTASACVAATAAAGHQTRDSGRALHVRHKRTVSDFVEGLMNAVYYHMDSVPEPSTVIAHITHMPAPRKVYKYVPMQKLKLSKLRARQVAEPKVKLRYPKKFSIKTEDSSLTLLKNDLPWTLHPLPPPMPTAKAIKLEVDKSMPWALHPLPPPVKTKNFSDYYWPDAKKHSKYLYGAKLPRKHNHLINNYKYSSFKPLTASLSGFKPVDYNPADYKHVDYKHVDYKHVDYNPVDYKAPDFKTMEYNPPKHKPVDYNKPVADYKPVDYNKPVADYKPVVDYEPDDYNHVEYNPVDYRHVDYKHVHYKHVNYKSPDYNNKPEYPKHADEDTHNDVESQHHDDHHHHHHHHDDDDHDDDHHDHIYQGSYQHHNSHHHDDHSAEVNESQSPSSQTPETVEYVSHITIEPSIQIASFSETDMQSDGSSHSGVSHGDQNQKCPCTVNGHRHKRDATDSAVAAAAGGKPRGTITGNSSTVAATSNKDSDVGQSLRNSYVTQNVGHATEVQIQKSHDITDQSVINNPNGYVQQVRNLNAGDQSALRNRGGSKKTDTPSAFRDDSDRFKVDFGREINAWDEPGKSTAANNNKGRFVTSPSHGRPNYDERDEGGADIDGGQRGGGGGGFDIDDFRNRLARKPSPERGYHVTKSTVENTGRGVSFSVQTPFSVSSFSSNVHQNPDERRSRFRYSNNNNNEPKTTALLSSFPSEHSSGEPLDFEQFGLQSAAALDDKNPGRLETGHFPRGFDDDRRFEGGRFSTDFSDHFGGDNDDRHGVDFTSGRLSSQFSRDFGDNDDDGRGKRPKPLFRYNDGKSTSDRFGGGGGGGGRFKSGRTSSDESVLEYFQPVVLDFESKSRDENNNDFRLQFGNNNNNNGGGGSVFGNDKQRFFGGKTDSAGGFSKFKKDREPDPLRLPGRLHESNENLSRKMLFHPSTFDID